MPALTLQPFLCLQPDRHRFFVADFSPDHAREAPVRPSFLKLYSDDQRLPGRDKEKNMKKIQAVILLLGLSLLTTACAKKVAKTAPPSPPPPAVPTATLSASSSTIQSGQSTELNWQTSNANEITITGLGTVPPSGSRSVTPSGSITYTLTAKGPGGVGEANARVTVNPASTTASVSPSDEELFGRSVKDIFFDYDHYEIRSQDLPVTQGDASFLAHHPAVKVLIEGHCDDRGSDEYNLALGASRANSVKQALQAQGVSADRITTVSYGKEKPFCNDDNETCWQQNRRDHFAFQR
jgi:peptidoglycan-associated lipoprotein